LGQCQRMPEAQSPVRTGLVETECRRVSWKGSYTTLEIEKQVVVVATVNAFLTVGFRRARMLYRRIASLAETINVPFAALRATFVRRRRKNPRSRKY